MASAKKVRQEMEAGKGEEVVRGAVSIPYAIKPRFQRILNTQETQSVATLLTDEMIPINLPTLGDGMLQRTGRMYNLRKLKLSISCASAPLALHVGAYRVIVCCVSGDPNDIPANAHVVGTFGGDYNQAYVPDRIKVLYDETIVLNSSVLSGDNEGATILIRDFYPDVSRIVSVPYPAFPDFVKNKLYFNVITPSIEARMTYTYSLYYDHLN